MKEILNLVLQYQILFVLVLDFWGMDSSSENENIKLFGKKLRIIRKSNKLSLEKLSNMADMELSQLHRIEAGKTNPKLSTIFILAKALGISPKELFD
jgi:DNA-binding XRE family transcriptional regulator